jgi:hypothetical protein
MSPAAGAMLLRQIVPLIAGAIARGAVKTVGCEDLEELKAEGCAMAASMLERAESRGKVVAPSSIAYYALQALKSGRRSGFAGRMDALCPSAALEGAVQLRSMDEGIGSDENDPDQEFTLHDVLAAKGEDTDVAAARELDWDAVTPQLDDRRRTILQGTAEGRGTLELASELDISPPRVCQVRESLGRYIVNAWGSNGLEDVTTATKWRAGLRAATERRACRYLRRGC